MKKTITLSLVLALAASMSADKVKVLTFGFDMPDVQMPELEGLGISPDGKYACGSLSYGNGMFVADTETGLVAAYAFTSDEDEGAQLRHVDNNGLGIGFDGPGVTFSLDGVRTVLSTPEGYKFVLGEDINADGSVMVGSICEQGYVTHAAYCKGDGAWTFLPMPDKDAIGGFDRDDSSAKAVSCDGKVIAGFLGSFGVATAWIMNESGEYEADPFFVKVVALSDEEIANGSKPLTGLTTCGISDNGKYVLCSGSLYDDDEIRSVPVVYNTEDKSFKIYDEVQEIDDAGEFLTPISIANDGTFIGVVGQPWSNSGAFIMNAGENQARLWVDEFPAFAEKFGYFDLGGGNTPADMSADGRYIVGRSYYSEDVENEDSYLYEVTYILDRETGGSSVSELSQTAGEQTVYSLDGQKLREMAKGINIVKGADGKVRKVIKK